MWLLLTSFVDDKFTELMQCLGNFTCFFSSEQCQTKQSYWDEQQKKKRAQETRFETCFLKRVNIKHVRVFCTCIRRLSLSCTADQNRIAQCSRTWNKK